MLTNDKHSDIMLIYQWLLYEMRRQKCRMSLFPKNTDPKKTYMYKDLSAFHRKVVEEMDLGHGSVRKVIEIIVSHARERNILNRGVKILNVGNLMEICKVYLEAERGIMENKIKSIKATKDHIDKYKLNSVMALSSPRHIGGYSNLYYLIESGRMSIEYMILSKTASRALAKLPPDERQRLPNDTTLAHLRLKAIETGKALIYQEILGSDLYLTPLGCH